MTLIDCDYQREIKIEQRRRQVLAGFARVKMKSSVVVTGDKLSPVSLLPAINYRRCHGIDENPGRRLSTGVQFTGDYLLLATMTQAIIHCRCC
jgi:hypothetical protein